MQYIVPIFYVLYLKWQNCEIYITVISVTSGHHMPISGCSFSVQE